MTESKTKFKVGDIVWFYYLAQNQSESGVVLTDKFETYLDSFTGELSISETVEIKLTNYNQKVVLDAKDLFLSASEAQQAYTTKLANPWNGN